MFSIYLLKPAIDSLKNKKYKYFIFGLKYLFHHHIEVAYIIARQRLLYNIVGAIILIINSYVISMGYELPDQKVKISQVISKYYLTANLKCLSSSACLYVALQAGLLALLVLTSLVHIQVSTTVLCIPTRRLHFRTYMGSDVYHAYIELINYEKKNYILFIALLFLHFYQCMSRSFNYCSTFHAYIFYF